MVWNIAKNVFDNNFSSFTSLIDSVEFSCKDWSDPEKIAKCNDTLIPHFTFNPDYTFGISIAVITVLLAGYGVYKGFFANKNLTDPWDDHDD